ncbi:MAG: MG2 domain-containing protein [Synergistaceae bacterium]|nr:MG2 domain-containing protein [Synergistaceae bacterium]
MKKITGYLFVLIIGLLIISAPAFSAVPAIKSFSPTGTTTDNPQFRAVYSSPVIEEDAVGKLVSMEDFPFQVNPAIIADGKWESTTVFTATLVAPLQMATAFTATAGGKKYNFQTEPLKLLSASQSSYSRSSGVVNVQMKLEFNIPVSPSRLASFLKVATSANAKLNFSCIGGLPSKIITVETKLSGKYEDENKLVLTIGKGLTGNTGFLGLEKEVSRAVEISPMLVITDSRVYEYDESRIVIETNNKVDLDKAKRFITVEPTSNFRLESRWSGFAIVGDFKPRQRVIVDIKKGVPAVDSNAKLTEDFRKAFIIPDKPHSVNFPASGMFLSPAVGTTIPIESTNINDLDITLWRLYESNIPYVLRNDSYRYSFPTDLSARVAKKTANISPIPNERERRAIDIKSFVDDDSGPLQGLYLITALEKGAYSWNQAEQIVSLSDIGLTARIWPGGCLVWANSISEAKPIENAEIKIYTDASQLITVGKTDSAGLYKYFPADLKTAPALVTASMENDVSFLRLNNPLITNETFDISGRAWITSGYGGMLFTPRGIYRPGETVNVKAIVREAGVNVASGFPVLFIVRDPMGRTFTRMTAALSAQGGADIEFQLPDAAPSGEYAVELCIPGKESEPFSVTKFSVEMFAPPRIEVEIERVDEGKPGGYITADEELTFRISSKYLFGVPSSNMPWRLNYQAVAGGFIPKGEEWRMFSFGDPEKSSVLQSPSDEIATGNLDEDGNALQSYTFEDSWNPPAVVNINITASVMEDSGRWIAKEMQLKYFPGSGEYLLGINAPTESPTNKAAKIRVAALAPDSKPIDKLNAKATIYKVTYHYNLVQRDGVTRWQSTQELVKYEEKAVTITKGMADFDFTPKNYGEYLVRVEAGEAKTSARFWSYDFDYDSGGGSRFVDRVEIETDKESYKAGETAKFTVKAPFAGTLLFTVENSKLIEQQAMKMSGVQAEVAVPIPEDLNIANLWCVATVLRPVKEDEPWAAHRAIGVKSIALDTSENKLQISIEAPDKISPNSKLHVKIQSAADSEVTLALVDEGVLQITGFNTPNPYGHFYSKCGLSSNLYDIYDQLMQIEPRATELLHPAGGMAAKAAAYLGNMDTKRFKILSIFKPTLFIGESGEAEIELDVPEFSGKTRLYAVGISGSSFGSAEKFVQIARDVVVEANLPRFAAMGDTFNSHVSVFNTSEKPQEVSVTLKTEGPLSINGQKEFSVNVPAKSSKSIEVEFEAPDIGSARYIVDAKFSGEEFAQEIDMQVRGLYPIVSRMGTGRFGAGETVITLPDDFAGTTERIITVTGTPVADLVPALNYLLRYPYGCLEQTVSTAWAVLAVPEAAKMSDPELVSQYEISRKLSAAISRIQAMQLYNGSFATWPGNQHSNDWASVYAAHFLSELRRANVLQPFPEDMWKGAMNFLRQVLAEPVDGNAINENLTTKAYACFVLALEKEAPLGLMYWLKENTKSILPSGQIWLAGAYALTDGKPEHLKAISGTVGAGAPMVGNPVTLDSTVRNAAQALLLWSLVQPEAPEAAALAEYLIQAGRIGRWYSTQENSVSTVALSNYIRAIGGQTETDLTCSLTDPSGEIHEPAREFKAQNNLSFQISEPGKWILKSEGSGNGYYSWIATGEPKVAPKPESQGITIETDWRDSKGKRITGDIKLGTEIVATVKIIPVVQLSDVVVSLLLPAGIEIESAPKTNLCITDARDDRLLMFFDKLNGSVEYKYTVRAVTKGNFALPPVSAEGMYNPAVKFIGKGGRVNIK